MSSTQLHEAVRIAQEGHRDEARQRLRQIVQAEPNNEMAWLWLASVAADQVEYERALREVLRINPANQQARDLLAQFQQVKTPPPVQGQPSLPPSQASSTPPPAPGPATPPPYYGGEPVPPQYQGAQGAPLPPYDDESYYEEPPRKQKPERVVYEVQHTSRRRRGCMPLPMGCGCGGCGCTQACLLIVLVFFVLPAVVCGALSMTSGSLGPADTVAVYLPDSLGRKTVSFDIQNDTVSVSVPRSWYPAIPGDSMWDSWRNVLDDGLIQFQNASQTWATLEVNPSAVSLQNGGVSIVETSPVTLMTSGAPSVLTFQGVVNASDYGMASFTCSAVRAVRSDLSGKFPQGGQVVGVEIQPQGSSDLCSARVDRVAATTGPVFADYAQPAEMRTIKFISPIDRSTWSLWQVTLPEDQYNMFKNDIARMVETAKVTPR